MNTPSPEKITRAEARKLSQAAGQPQEPYRGYGHDLKDGRFVFCAPDGEFYIRTTPMPTTTTQPAAQHTPGNWIVREVEGHGGNTYIEHETADVDVAIVLNPYPMPGVPSPDGAMTAQKMANARLIASAPALLAALEALLADSRVLDRTAKMTNTFRAGLGAHMEAARAAIAQARNA